MDKSDDEIISFGPPRETSSPIPNVTAYETIETTEEPQQKKRRGGRINTQYTTISRVLPSLIDLIEQCENGKKAKVSIQIASTYSSLKSMLESKFDYVLDPASSGFHPIYLISTFLDPNFLPGLDENMQHMAIKQCIQLFETQSRDIT